jgi:SOS response regulatory protein OraA/RecX
MLKNKIVENLSNLGYSKELVYNYINNISFNNNKEIAKKEYEKIYKKLSRKYSNEELEFKVRQKMYSLGFTDYED